LKGDETKKGNWLWVDGGVGGMGRATNGEAPGGRKKFLDIRKRPLPLTWKKGLWKNKRKPKNEKKEYI